MNTQKRVFNKLAEVEKVELATKKVELALVDDLKKQYNKALTNQKNANRRATIIRSEKSSLQGDIAEIMDNVKSLNINIEKLESGSKKLGIETPKEVALYKRLSNDFEVKYNKLLKEFKI